MNFLELRGKAGFEPIFEFTWREVAANVPLGRHGRDPSPHGARVGSEAPLRAAYVCANHSPS